MEAFASAFQLLQFIKFRTKVVEVMPLFEWQSVSSSHSLTNGCADSHASNHDGQLVEDELPWPRWQVTTAPAGNEVNNTPVNMLYEHVLQLVLF